MLGILSKILWKKYLSEDEELLWYGSENRAFGVSKLSAFYPLIFTISFSMLVIREVKHLDPLRVFAGFGVFFFGAWAFTNLVFFSRISYYAMTDRRIMEYCSFRLTEIKYSDVDYVGMGGIARDFRNLDRIMQNVKAAGYDIEPPELPDLSSFPDSFTIGAGDTEINLAVKDSTKPKRIITDHVRPDQFGSYYNV